MKWSNKTLDKIGKEIFSIEWRDIYINNKQTRYEISNTGLVWSSITNKTLTPKINRSGYLYIVLCIEEDFNHMKTYTKTIHRLVANAFIDNPEDKPQVNHIDGNKLNNHYTNLEWATAQENIIHSINTDLSHRIGVTNPNNKFNDEQIHKVCKMLEDKKDLKEIVKLTGVSRYVISNIKRGKAWKHISQKYNITKPVSNLRPIELKQNITDLINQEYNNKEIVQIVGLPDTYFEREYVGLFRRRLLKRSETIESIATEKDCSEEASRVH